MGSMLKLIAMADAYGADFEFARGAKLDKNTLSGYLEHNLDPMAPGRYSDDTQMSVAVAEALLGGEEPDRLAFASAFVDAFRRDPRKAYAHGFYEFLLETETGESFLKGIRSDSTRSGAAMRACPIGLAGPLPRVLALAERQAKITHDTPEGIASAKVVAAAVFHQARLEGRDGAPALFEFLNREVPGFGWGEAWSGRVSVEGLDCARAAVWVAGKNDSFSWMLQEAVSLTGDTDTVAAIGAGIASASPRYRIDPPAWMERDLERGPYGLDYLAALDARLEAWSLDQGRLIE